MFELRKTARSGWRKHINSEIGAAGMLYLNESAPSVGSNGDAHNIIFQAGLGEGYRLCLKRIYDIANDEEQESSLTIDNP